MSFRKVVNLLLAVACRWTPRSKGFDETWYRARYRDVARSGVDPLLHYCRFGHKEGRDPNAWTSTSGEWLYRSRRFRMEQLPGTKVLSLWGEGSYVENAPTILCCGHQAGKQLYGAERSFVDTLSALSQCGVNLIVTLPEAVNEEYIASILPHCSRLLILPYGWWVAGATPQQAVVERFETIIATCNVSAVYANTAVLLEPLIAGRVSNIPVAIHVRELPFKDPSLCDFLEATPEEVLQHVRSMSDYQIVNSEYTARSLDLENAIIVPNYVRVEEYQGLAPPEESGEPLRVGMISSNLPKKGLDDFLTLTRLLSDMGGRVCCKLIGPENEHTEGIRQRRNEGDVPDNLMVLGYIPKSQRALAEIDVLVNLSHFEESFGRTVLEAMAAGRPVIAYDRGALSELVKDGETGYLVSFGRVEEVKYSIERLLESPSLLDAFGRAGRERAAEKFGIQSAKDGLNAWLDAIYTSSKTG